MANLPAGSGGGGSSGSDSSSGSGDSSWLDFIDAGSERAALLKDPKLYILLVLYEFIVGGLLELFAAVLDGLADAFGLVAGIPMLFADALLAATGPLGAALLTPFEVAAGVLGALLAGAGPFSPIVAAVALVVLYKAVTALGTLTLGVLSPRLLVIMRTLNPLRWFDG